MSRCTIARRYNGDMDKLRKGVLMYQQEIEPAERLLAMIKERLSTNHMPRLSQEAWEHLADAEMRVQAAIDQLYIKARFRGYQLQLPDNSWIFADIHCCPDMKGLKAMLGMRGSAMKDPCAVCDVQVGALLLTLTHHMSALDDLPPNLLQDKHHKHHFLFALFTLAILALPPHH
jgi:hypothetical protein